MFRRTALLPLAALALSWPAPAGAGNYSGPGLAADVVITDPALGEGRFTGKFHFDRAGTRFDLNGKRVRFSALIFNSFNEYLITVSRRNDITVSHRLGEALSAQFGDEPCGGFKDSVSLGTESLAGRTIQVWRCERPRQPLLDAGFGPEIEETIWYDIGLKHFIRKENNHGVKIELRNIIAGRQPPALFDVPSDFAQLNSSSRIADVEAPR
ncbi:MAG: hypothetical protein JSU82_13445 [Rhodospirillales bacterium]|nr:MAG: hypothetical protein JSU82_13445 [Rhodospirillales bacterium]